MGARTTGVVAGGLLVIGGLAVIGGWYASSAVFVQLRADWVPVPFNAALCFALTGAALLAWHGQHERVTRVLGAIVAAFGAMTLVQFLFPLSLGIDELFVEAWVSTPLTHPGRMSPIAAAIFLMVGVVLTTRHRNGAWATGWVLIGAASLVAAVHLTGFADLSRVGPLGGALLALVGVGLLALGPAPRKRYQRFAALSVLSVALLGLLLWQVLVIVELTRVSNDTANAARSLVSQMVREHGEYLATLQRMAARLSVTQAGWLADAERYLNDVVGLKALVVYENRRVVAQAGGDPVEPDPLNWQLASRSQDPIVNSEFVLIPLANGRALVATTDFHERFHSVLDGSVPGFLAELSVNDRRVHPVEAQAGPPRNTPVASFTVPLAMSDSLWTGRVWPVPQTFAGHRGPVPLAVLVLCLIAAALVAAAFRFSDKLRNQLAVDDAIWRESRDILCTVDAEGRFLRVSEAARTIWGYAPQELVGKSHLIVSSPDERSADSEVVTGHRQIDGYVNNALRRDGTTLPMSWNSAWSKELGVMIAIGRDISAQVRHEAELEHRVAERTAELSAVNAELEAFSYSVSHDLRTPLRAIAGFTQVLEEEIGPKLDDSARHYLKRITEGVVRMGNLIDDLLRLGRVSRRDLTRQTVSLSDIASEVAGRLRDAEPARRLDFRIQEDLMVNADPILVEAMLDNLFGNSVKFTRDRDPAVIELVQEGGVFSVRDNGVGFDMKYAGVLFGVFQRLHHLHEYPGTGVGLATVKRIVERHGGRVWAHGEVGNGASVFFTFE